MTPAMRVLTVLESMLAATGPIAAPVEDWAFEPKLDGWRAMGYVDGYLSVRTRRGRDVSVRFQSGAAGDISHL